MVAAKQAFLALQPDARLASSGLPCARSASFRRAALGRYEIPGSPRPAGAADAARCLADSSTEGKGTKGRVTNQQEWVARKRELLELAQFYEYGYKPRLGEDYTIALTDNNFNGDGNPGRQREGDADQRALCRWHAAGHDHHCDTAAASAGRPARADFLWRQLALPTASPVSPFPSWAGDSRSDAGAWGNPNRTGTFYRLFPYVRNSAYCRFEHPDRQCHGRVGSRWISCRWRWPRILHCGQGSIRPAR